MAYYFQVTVDSADPHVRVGADNVERVLEEVQASGATFLHRASQGPHSWVTVADPEGNEFCIT